jgi:asparagine synthase (glutamine-hydrolysing)
MPGILGLVSFKNRGAAERELRQMLEAMCHEKFYVTGTWVNESLGVYVGWVARRGSFADGMPLHNEGGDIALTFAGEEFSEPNTKPQLRQHGHEFDPVGPAYLVHLYEEEPSFPASLNGRFHGIVADAQRGTCTLFNDRYGMERLYYHQTKDAFYFAAEAKAILAVLPELRTLDPRALGEFISCGAVLENRSFFSGIQVLPPGSSWTFRKGSVEQKSTYFHPKEWEEQETLDAESYYREFREVFTRSLPRYLDGAEQVAMSLTGGLDTRMIMAWQKTQPGTLPCYTFGSMFHENHDVRIARQVARACGQPFQVITAGQEFLSRFAHYAERAIYLGEGGVDLGRSPDLYLSERIREIAPIRLTGDYGGEILRRVRTFKPAKPLPGLFSSGILSYVELAGKTLEDLSNIHPLSFTIFRQAPWDYRGVVGLEQSQLAIRTPYFDNGVVKNAFRAPSEALTSSQASFRLISDGNGELSRIPTDRGLTGTRASFEEVIRQTSLEIQFKAEYAYDIGMPQWLARADHAFSTLRMERLFLGRHKVFHFRNWYRDFLAGYVREMLLDPRSLSRPYLDPRGLEKVVAGHLRGDRNYTNEIHKTLTLELINRLFVDCQ